MERVETLLMRAGFRDVDISRVRDIITTAGCVQSDDDYVVELVRSIVSMMQSNQVEEHNNHLRSSLIETEVTIDNTAYLLDLTSTIRNGVTSSYDSLHEDLGEVMLYKKMMGVLVRWIGIDGDNGTISRLTEMQKTVLSGTDPLVLMMLLTPSITPSIETKLIDLWVEEFNRMGR